MARLCLPPTSSPTRLIVFVFLLVAKRRRAVAVPNPTPGVLWMHQYPGSAAGGGANEGAHQVNSRRDGVIPLVVLFLEQHPALSLFGGFYHLSFH